MKTFTASWTCDTCGHEALDYDEVDHECMGRNGKPFEYEAKGTELTDKINEDGFQER